MPKYTKPNYPYHQKYTVPFARKLSPTEQTQVDYYRGLRESFHDGPYYSVLDASSSNAKKGSAARANFDPFHGMPTYSGRYQKKRRTLPKITGRSYGKSQKIWQSYGHSLLTAHTSIFSPQVLPPRAMANPPAKLPTRRLSRRLSGSDFSCWIEARL